MPDMIATAGKSDILSNLTTELEEIEKKHIKSHCDELAQARTDLATALHAFTRSRLEVGKILFEYRGYYKRRHGWVDAAEAIGNAIHRNKRTVYRMIQDYEIATQIPQLLLYELEKIDIDPTQAQYLKLAQVLLKIQNPSSSEDAKKKVEEALARVEEISAKKSIKAEPDSPEVFANKIARKFVRRFEPKTPKESRNEVRNILEMIAAALGAETSELPNTGDLVLQPKPDPDVRNPKTVTNASKSGKSRVETPATSGNLFADATDVAA